MKNQPILLLDLESVGKAGETLTLNERAIPSLARLHDEGPFAFGLLAKEGQEPLVELLESQGVCFDFVIRSEEELPDWVDMKRSVLVSVDGKMGDWAGEKGCKVVCYGKGEGFYYASSNWNDIACFLLGDGKHTSRTATVNRTTKETQIQLALNLDGTGKGRLETGIGFFDHMLDQVVRHALLDVELSMHGDLEVDEHHSVEDVAIVLGECVLKALGDKKGISRYGYEILSMDDVDATVSLDFSGRPDFIWHCPFSRDYVGTFPTEMICHFFKSFSDSARCNLHMQVTKGNTHHQAEALFKAFAHALRQAVRRYYWSDDLPSTKGSL